MMKKTISGLLLMCGAAIAAPTNDGLYATLQTTVGAVHADDGVLKDGIYSGKAGGHNGPVQVAVIVRNGRIIRVEVVRHKEKKKRALSEIPRKIVAEQSTDVDAVSGATYSSEAIMNAVKNALKQAR